MGRLPFDLEINDIAALADIINQKKLGEICLEDEENGEKIVIKGAPCPPPPPQPMPPIAMPVTMPAVSAAPQTAVSQAAPAAPAAAASAEGNTVKSPLVGTYYEAPAPGKPPFVTVGKKVRKGDVIMIIESMKLMNEIQSEFDGEVKEILVKNGQAVEFDQPVMIIG
ncbi:MAG: acetyl-CoA carboxylase biotin carboxyl carrier protein [Huintestinicola sp.]